MRHRTFGSFGALYYLTRALNVKADDSVCIANMQQGLYGADVGLDAHGKPVSNIADAVAMTLSNCWKYCADRSLWAALRSQWLNVLTQFAAWELPWLALVSQLPYDPNANNLENFQTVLLMIGSPALTGYTQAMTILNNRWVNKQFARSELPNSHYLVRVLSDFQHVPFNINSDVRLLGSLLALPENRDFWETLISWMNSTHSNLWTAYTKFSIAWTIIAYAITVADGFEGSYWPTLSSHGQSIGATWSWLIPAVLIWMRLSPKNDVKKLQAAISAAHAKVYVVDSTGQIGPVEELDPLFEVDFRRQKHTWHLESAAPIHNHSRFYAWSQLVEFLSQTNSAISRLGKMVKHAHKVDNPNAVYPFVADSSPAESVLQFENVIQKGWDADVARWTPGTLQRSFIAALFGLFLQSGTTGAAFIMNYFTPTYGLGCSSLASLVYGVFAVLSATLIVASSALSHQQATAQPSRTRRSAFASALRFTGKGLAYINAIVFIIGNIAEIALLTQNCFCNSSWFSRGKGAYVVLFMDTLFLPSWIGGVGMVVLTTVVYLLLLNLLIPRRLPNAL